MQVESLEELYEKSVEKSREHYKRNLSNNFKRYVSEGIFVGIPDEETS